MIILNKKSKNLPIGLFDSGVGGLTVLNRLKRILPNEKYIYYGDTLHMPYGEKSKDQLLSYSNNIFKFFEQKSCKAVVMACNTTSSVIYEDVKDKYNFKLYSIVHSVSEILANMNLERLGIFATRATINSGAYQKYINQFNPKTKTFGQYCPNWVHIVEENSMNKLENVQIVESDLAKMMKNNPEKILLGCTHYPFLLPVLEKFAPKELFIDPSIYFANAIKQDLEKMSLLNDESDGCEEFYVSSNPQNFKTSAAMFYCLEKIPNLLKFEKD